MNETLFTPTDVFLFPCISFSMYFFFNVFLFSMYFFFPCVSAWFLCFSFYSLHNTDDTCRDHCATHISNPFLGFASTHSRRHLTEFDCNLITHLGVKRGHNRARITKHGQLGFETKPGFECGDNHVSRHVRRVNQKKLVDCVHDGEGVHLGNW